VTDDDLRDLLTDAVSDVEPAYRLDTIKARTHRPARRGWYAVGGAILAAAAVVAAVSVVSDDNRPRREGPAANPTQTVGLYFVGETPAGQRLYREFRQLPANDPLAALTEITMARGPQDPDYRTAWPEGSFEAVEVTGGRFDVELGPAALSLSMRSPLNVQQVVYTLQAATGEPLSVQFTEAGQTIAGTLHERAPQNDVLALMSVSDPSEGLHVEGSFVARGRANSFEGTVPWEIRDASDAAVLDGFTTAEGSGDQLYKWETEAIDVSDLAPGTYTFVAMTDDPSGGEGLGPFTDTRTIIVE